MFYSERIFKKATCSSPSHSSGRGDFQPYLGAFARYECGFAIASGKFRVERIDVAIEVSHQRTAAVECVECLENALQRGFGGEPACIDVKFAVLGPSASLRGIGLIDCRLQ